MSEPWRAAGIARSPASRRSGPPSPYTSIAVRAHVEPKGWLPRRHQRRPTPAAALIVHSVPRDEPGEPSAYTLFALVGPSFGHAVSPRGFALPEPEPILLGASYPWDATSRDIDQLAQACETNGLNPPIPQKELTELLMRCCWTDRAALAAFQVPVEIGRLQVRWVTADRDPGRGGIVCTLATVPGKAWRRQPACENGEIEDPDLPRIVVSAIDARRHRIWFKPVHKMPRWDGVFVSLQTFAEGLCGGERFERISDALEAFDVDGSPPTDASGFELALAEVRAQCRLFPVLLEQHVGLCPDEPPTPYLSAGTYAKALLRKAVRQPPLWRWPDFPRDALAATEAAYYAGEVFVHLRGTKLPALLLDFGGAYTIAGTLIGAWDVLAAEEVVVQDVEPEEASRLLVRVAEEFRAFARGYGPPPSQESWEAAWMTVFVEPGSQLLPHRPRDGETWTATRAPLTYRKGDLPFQAPDLIGHLIEGGELPPITRALRLLPKGRITRGIVTLPTGREVDLATDDLVRVLGDERFRIPNDPRFNWHKRRRLRGLLKGITVSALAGLTVQVNDDEPTEGQRTQRVFDFRTGKPTDWPVHVLEKPGDWYWPPLAAAITATARLLLHLVIEAVHAAGGIVAYWDTDSVLIVALPEGGLVPCPGGSERMPDGREAVRALSFAEVRAIQWRIDELLDVPDDARPYVTASAPDGTWARVPQPRMLELEPENYDGPCGFRTTQYVATRASKKYHLYRTEHVGGHVEIVDGCPTLIEPTPERASRPHAIRPVWTSAHALPYEAPEEAPAWLIDGTKHLLEIEWGMPSAIPAFSDAPAIMVVPASRPDTIGRHPAARPYCRLGVGQMKLGGGQVVAPLHSSFDPQTADWRDSETRSVRTSLPGANLLTTLGAVQRRAWNAVDRRTLDHDGRPTGSRTEGVIVPLQTIASGVHRMGKESRHLGIGRGVLDRPEFIDYGGDDPWSDVLAAARRLRKDAELRRRLEEACGLGERGLRYAVKGERMPSRVHRLSLGAATADEARGELLRHDPFRVLPPADEDVIAAFLDTPEPERRCSSVGGRSPVGPANGVPNRIAARRAARSSYRSSSVSIPSMRRTISEGLVPRAGESRKSILSDGPLSPRSSWLM